MSVFSFDSVARVYDFVLPKREPVELLNAMNTNSNDDILEIGAGTGRIAKFYADEVKSLTLLDPSVKMLEKAAKILPDAKQVIGVVEEMEFDDNSFDKIVGYDSLHHWQDQNKGLKEALRVLKQGGKMFLVEVDPTVWRGKMVMIFERLMRMKSVFHHADILTEMIKNAGFAEVKFHPGKNNMTYILECIK